MAGRGLACDDGADEIELLWSALSVGMGCNMKSITRPDGSTMLVDDATVSYLESAAPQPTQASLARILGSTHRVQVVRGGSSNGAPFGTEVLAISEAPDRLEELRRSLQIREGGGGHCMCHGDPSLVLSNQSGEVVAVLGVHHGFAIRWGQWKDDAVLVDGERLLQWLVSLGVEYPMDEFQASRRRELASRVQATRWQAAMPSALAAHPVFDLHLVYEPSPVVPVLERVYPDPRVRALALFEWFGHGEGPWSGFPAYEQLPEKLLLAMPMDCLLAALHSDNLTSAQLEGAARLFAGWDFGTNRKRDLVLLTPSDRQKLLGQALRSTDPDKHARARKAFEARG